MADIRETRIILPVSFIGPMAEFTIPIVGLGIDGALLFSRAARTR